MDKLLKKKIIKISKSYSAIKLVYFFGSRAQDKHGPLSDYDFAIYTTSLSSRHMVDLRLKFISQISHVLKTDAIDVLILNSLQSPELKFDIIKNGKCLLAIEPFKMLFEMKTLNQYFDFQSLLRRHHLTKI